MSASSILLRQLRAIAARKASGQEHHAEDDACPVVKGKVQRRRLFCIPKPAAIPSAMLPRTEQPVGMTSVSTPRRSSSFAPPKVKGVPACSLFLKYVSANFARTACPAQTISQPQTPAIDKINAILLRIFPSFESFWMVYRDFIWYSFSDGLCLGFFRRKPGKAHTLRFHGDFLDLVAVWEQLFFVLQKGMVQRRARDSSDLVEGQRQLRLPAILDMAPRARRICS